MKTKIAIGVVIFLFIHSFGTDHLFTGESSEVQLIWSRIATAMGLCPHLVFTSLPVRRAGTKLR